MRQIQAFSKFKNSLKSRIDFLPGKKTICFVVERVIMKPLSWSELRLGREGINQIILNLISI